MATQNEAMRATLEKMLETDPKAALEAAMAETERVRATTKPSVKLDRQGRITEADMDGLYRMGTMYSRTALVPEHFRGKPEDCAIACGLAMRWQLDPLMVMQSSYIVHGRPGIEGKLMIALLNASGKIKGRLRFRLEGQGKDRKCTCTAIDEETGDEVSAEVTWAMVEAEGWNKDKKGFPSKWSTLPDLMFQYRSAAFLARVHYPEVLMGMRTTDEIEDTVRAEPETTAARNLDDVRKRLMAEMEPVGTVSHTGPLPSDEELAQEDQEDPGDDLESFRQAIRRKLGRCEGLESLEKTGGQLLKQNRDDKARHQIVTEEVCLRDADIRDQEVATSE